MDLQYHEYANLFPMLGGEALEGLRNDIAKNGVREPIVTIGGLILDGRNRYVCATELGIDFPTREFDGDDPLGFVISHNLHRRHLTESQRASIAARVANMPRGANQYNKASANWQTLPQLSLSDPAAPRPPLTSTGEAARLLNVSERSVARASKVQEHAPEEIVRAVDDGRMSVSLASKVADLPDETKAEIIAAEDVRQAAREAVKKAHVANNSGNNEWYTPPEYIEAARAVMGGIDLDPASSEIANRRVLADKIFTAEDDGLAQEWPICRIWMNPPYAQPLMGQFATKFAQEIRRGSEGIVLVNNATETAWFHEIAEVSSAICFPKGRIRFLDPEGNPGAPLQGQAIIYSGPNVKEFFRRFLEFGLVLIH